MSRARGESDVSVYDGALEEMRKIEKEQGGKVHKEGNRAFRAYNSMEEAARGYLLAMQNKDPAAAQNPAFQHLWELLQDPATTPDTYARALQSAGFAINSTVGNPALAFGGPVIDGRLVFAGDKFPRGTKVDLYFATS